MELSNSNEELLGFFSTIPKTKGRPKPALIAPDLSPPRPYSFNTPASKGMILRQQERYQRSPCLPQASIPVLNQQSNPTTTPVVTPIYASGDYIPQGHWIEPDEISNQL